MDDTLSRPGGSGKEAIVADETTHGARASSSASSSAASRPRTRSPSPCPSPSSSSSAPCGSESSSGRGGLRDLDLTERQRRANELWKELGHSEEEIMKFFPIFLKENGLEETFHAAYNEEVKLLKEERAALKAAQKSGATDRSPESVGASSKRAGTEAETSAEPKDEIPKVAAGAASEKAPESLDDSEEESEHPICRICRCGSEVAPLFHPCQCSGSIKYVHEECLEEWLRHSYTGNADEKGDFSGAKCELCSSPFVFQNVFAQDTPARLSIYGFLSELWWLIATGILPVIFRVCLCIFSWLYIVPIINTICFRTIFDQGMSWENTWDDVASQFAGGAFDRWTSGCAIQAFIIVGFLAILSVFDYCRMHNRAVELEEQFARERREEMAEMAAPPEDIEDEEHDEGVDDGGNDVLPLQEDPPEQHVPPIQPLPQARPNPPEHPAHANPQLRQRINPAPPSSRNLRKKPR